MSAEPDPEEIRDRVRDILNFEPPERPPCTQVLGIGLTEDVCESDDGLKRWLVCKSVEFVVEEGESLGDAIGEAFDLADDQCDFFDLERPEGRRTDFGPLQAQRVREEEEPEDVVQGTLPGTEPDVDEEPPTIEPQRVEGGADRGQQTGLGGPATEESARATEEARRRQERQERQAEQERPRSQERLGGADEPARISEFDKEDDDPDPISVEDVEEAGRGRPDRQTFTLRGMVPDLDFSQDVIGQTFEVTEPGRLPTTRELPNSAGTWERVGSIDQLQWRSQNANGYDVLWVEELPGERGGGRPFMLFVGTVPRQGATPDDVTIVLRNLAFIPMVNGVQDYLDANRDGRGGSGNQSPRR